ncbi:MAG: hypothetical protein NTY07_21445 [Bacteroidia bacterium]|nr:hypothetical protein [Bacteroidia bacterium]
METIELPQLLLIAGTGRNTGKTTFACNIIRKFSNHNSIIALKITPHFHKNVQNGNLIINSTNLYIAEETDSTSGKDSSLMLAAGAQQSFFVMATDKHLSEAIQEVLKILPSNALLVCESGGLRDWIVPGLFFMMNRKDNGLIKPTAEKLKLLADRLITFDGEKIDFELDTIEITGNQWILKH